MGTNQPRSGMGFGGMELVEDIKSIIIFGAARGLRAEGRVCGIAENNIINSKARGASPTKPLNNQHTSILRAGQVVSRSLANAVYLTKHDGNGDNRFAILIQGSEGANDFRKGEYKGSIQEMGRILTEHPGNKKPGPGYTGYYLQDHIFHAGVYDDIPEVDRDVEVTNDNGKTDILNMIVEVARHCDSYDKVMLFYVGYGDEVDIGGITDYYFDANNDNTFSAKDLTPSVFDNYLDTIECEDFVIILQPDYSGNWIDDLKEDVISTKTYPEKNRIIITSEGPVTVSYPTKTAVMDKCRKDIEDSTWYAYYSGLYPSKEDFKESKESGWKYAVIDDASGVRVLDDIYEIDKDDDGTYDFYENYNDVGPEFVSGFTEAYYIDRDYYYGISSHHEPNGYLDADEDEEPEISAGNSNKYVSMYETFYFILNWHLSYRLGDPIRTGESNPWYDNPQIEYTWFEHAGDMGTTYLY